MSSTKKIRILCVDDHPIVREGLASIIALQPDMELAGEAESGAEALHLLRALAIDIALVDLRLKDMSGHELTRQILAHESGRQVIVLTSYEGDADIQRAFAAGARGYVVKGTGRDELLAAIRTVHAGRRHIPGSVAEKIAEHLGSEKLTDRELQVLAEIAAGKRNKEVGAALGIAEDTVKMHVKNILEKLEVNDRTEAVTVALRRGILHL
ncbi:response regulator [Acidicapsa acidisoli]|uniref:response regulator n=1 Tax=Acidicapsa acidisoli TaxID=1615681 RepID=UPI0021DFB161|nr:response regulator transcription factor [Acidicapsa acidisoli]